VTLRVEADGSTSNLVKGKFSTNAKNKHRTFFITDIQSGSGLVQFQPFENVKPLDDAVCIGRRRGGPACHIAQNLKNPRRPKKALIIQLLPTASD
jgi:hypothetical protein